MSLNSWQSFPLSTLCEEIFDGPHATPTKTEEGPIFLGISNLTSGRIDLSTIEHLSEEDFVKWTRRVTPQPGDLVFSYETRLGEAALIPEGLRCCLGRRMGLMRFDTAKVEPKFMLYAYLGPEFQQTIQARTVHGSTVDRIPLIELPSFPISIPDLPTQRRIADILSALDDKIELNRQTNATLEAMAQAIFKEWFVDFNYPGATGELVESELGLIPAGWRVGKLGEISKIKHGFAFKGEFFSEEETENILLTPGNFRIGGGFNYSKMKYYNGEYSIEYKLEPGDLVVTMTDLSKDGDTLGYSAFVPEIEGKKLLHNQRIGKVEVVEDAPWKMYLYYLMQQRGYRHYILGSATGTTVKHTSPSRICDHRIVLPPLNLLSQFESIAKSLTDAIEHNYAQCFGLAQTRDTLLPKLMQGEISI